MFREVLHKIFPIKALSCATKPNELVYELTLRGKRQVADGSKYILGIACGF